MYDIRITKRTDVDWHEWKCEYRAVEKWIWGGSIVAFSSTPPIPVEGHRVSFYPSQWRKTQPTAFIAVVSKFMRELEENEELYKHDTNS